MDFSAVNLFSAKKMLEAIPRRIQLAHSSEGVGALISISYALMERLDEIGADRKEPWLMRLWVGIEEAAEKTLDRLAVLRAV